MSGTVSAILPKQPPPLVHPPMMQGLSSMVLVPVAGAPFLARALPELSYGDVGRVLGSLSFVSTASLVQDSVFPHACWWRHS